MFSIGLILFFRNTKSMSIYNSKFVYKPNKKCCLHINILYCRELKKNIRSGASFCFHLTFLTINLKVYFSTWFLIQLYEF